MTRSLVHAAQVLLAEEASFAAQPSSGWVQVQPNVGGIKGWINKFKTEESDPISPDAALRAGEVVGSDATPELEINLTKDLIDIVAGPAFRTVTKHNGNTGLSLFRPTAVTSTGYTVAASGALTAGFIVNAQGFPTAANNGPKVVGASSTNLEIKASGLTAESVADTLGATLEVCGVQGASGDIQIDADGNIISTVLDFTTLGLQQYQWIKVGGPSTNAATRFATTAYNRAAKLITIATNKLTLSRRDWTVGAADTGTGKTIWLLFSRFYRNRALDDSTNYREPTLHGELTEQSVGAGGAATYTYAQGMALKALKLNAPLESKIVASLSFCAKNIADPVLAASRATGAASPRRPMAAGLFHTASPQFQRSKLTKISDGSTLAAEVNSWTLTLENDVEPREIQGGLGAEDMLYGKYMPSATMEIYYTSSEVAAAMRSNPEVAWDVQVRNNQAGFIIDMPYVRVRGGERSFAGKAVMCSLDIPGFLDPTSNVVVSLTVFAYWPE